MISTKAFALLATLPQTAALLMENKSENEAQQIDQKGPSIKSQLESQGLIKHAELSLQDHMERYEQGVLIHLRNGTTKKYNFGSDSCLLVFERNDRHCEEPYIESPWLIVEKQIGIYRYSMTSGDENLRTWTVSVVRAGFSGLQEQLQPEVFASNRIVRVTYNLKCMDHKLDDDEVRFFQGKRWEYVSLLKMMVEKNLVADKTMLCWSKRDSVKLLPNNSFETFHAGRSDHRFKIQTMMEKISEVFTQLAPPDQATAVQDLVKEKLQNTYHSNAMHQVHEMLLELKQMQQRMEQEKK